MKPLAWITGAGGFLGGYLVRAASSAAPEWRVHGLTRNELDLTDSTAVRALFEHERPRLVIHCAALSRADDCQKHPDLARRVNVEVTARLAELAADIPFVLLSTDLVFDGRKGHYVESDPVNPLSLYGETKAEAEQVVLKNPGHLVLRTSLNAGVSSDGGRSFSERLRAAWEAGQTTTLFTDEFRSPIPAAVTARAAWHMALAGHAGLYHLGGRERLSRWEIARLLAAHWPGVKPRLQPGSLRNYQGPPRPADTSLCCEKIQACLPFALPRFSEWLETHPDEPL